ncbi:CBS domain-containing protein [Chloroflexota bacterium]
MHSAISSTTWCITQILWVFFYVDDTLAQALSIMLKSDLIVLPVIGETQQIIGSLTLSELLNLALTEK